jgi:hypothetical protein
VLTDLCFNVQRADSGLARAFFRARGLWQRLTLSDRAAFRRSLEQVLAWDFARIVPSHGEVLEQSGPAALRAAWRIQPEKSSQVGADCSDTPE